MQHYLTISLNLKYVDLQRLTTTVVKQFSQCWWPSQCKVSCSFLNNCGQDFFSSFYVSTFKFPVSTNSKPALLTCQAVTSENSWESCHFTTLKLTDPLSYHYPRGIISSVRKSATILWSKTWQIYLLLVTLEPDEKFSSRCLFCTTTDGSGFTVLGS